MIMVAIVVVHLVVQFVIISFYYCFHLIEALLTERVLPFVSLLFTTLHAVSITSCHIDLPLGNKT